MINKYLFLAFSLTWLIFILYAWNLARRQAELRKEIEDLRAKLQAQPPERSRTA